MTDFEVKECKRKLARFVRMLPSEVAFDHSIREIDKGLYSYLLHQSKSKSMGVCPSLKTMAEKVGYDPQTVLRSIRRLVMMKLLVVKQGSLGENNTNMYIPVHHSARYKPLEKELSRLRERKKLNMSFWDGRLYYTMLEKHFENGTILRGGYWLTTRSGKMHNSSGAKDSPELIRRKIAGIIRKPCDVSDDEVQEYVDKHGIQMGGDYIQYDCLPGIGVFCLARGEILEDLPVIHPRKYELYRLVTKENVVVAEPSNHLKTQEEKHGTVDQSNQWFANARFCPKMGDNGLAYSSSVPRDFSRESLSSSDPSSKKNAENQLKDKERGYSFQTTLIANTSFCNLSRDSISAFSANAKKGACPAPMSNRVVVGDKIEIGEVFAREFGVSNEDREAKKKSEKLMGATQRSRGKYGYAVFHTTPRKGLIVSNAGEKKGKLNSVISDAINKNKVANKERVEKSKVSAQKRSGAIQSKLNAGGFLRNDPIKQTSGKTKSFNKGFSTILIDHYLKMLKKYFDIDYKMPAQGIVDLKRWKDIAQRYGCVEYAKDIIEFAMKNWGDTNLRKTLWQSKGMPYPSPKFYAMKQNIDDIVVHMTYETKKKKDREELGAVTGEKEYIRTIIKQREEEERLKKEKKQNKE